MRQRICVTTFALMPAFILVQLGAIAAQDRSAAADIRMQDLKAWTFEGGAWSETAEGVMQPPKKFEDYYTAFYQPKSFGDIEANFEVRLEKGFCDAGLIFHAQDAQHYYLVHFPTGGQQWRAKHFWVAISRVDSGGYKHILKLAMVPQVDSNLFVWHQTRVVVKGSEVRAWVDGHFAAEASDPGLSRPGRVGVAGFGLNPADLPQARGRFSIRALQVQGDATTPTPWPDDIHPVKNWFQPCPDATYGKWQLLPSIVRTPKGDLLMAFQVTGAAGWMPNSTTEWLLSRSTDNGRHWSKPERAQIIWPEELPKGSRDRQGILFLTADHRLKLLDIVSSGEQGTRIYTAESLDDGHTWGKVRKQGTTAGWPKNPNILDAYNSVLLLRDGTLLVPLQGDPRSSAMNYYEFDWGAPQCQAYSMRSTDGGKSWAAPVDMDGSPAIPLADKPRSTNLDLTESSCAQLRGGTVKCFMRPNNSPFMWVAESKDSGQSWGPTTFGPFPGYAANTFYTSGGAMLVAHRMPDLAINTSSDEGLNWDEGTIVGTDIWAMGDMVEVAPNVVLFVYMDTQQGFLRGQFIRVTPQGLEPALEMLPKGQ